MSTRDEVVRRLHDKRCSCLPHGSEGCGEGYYDQCAIRADFQNAFDAGAANARKKIVVWLYGLRKDAYNQASHDQAYHAEQLADRINGGEGR